MAFVRQFKLFSSKRHAQIVARHFSTGSQYLFSETPNGTPPSPLFEKPTPYKPRFWMKEIPLVWVECKMTGLNLSKDKIIEVAAIITDKDLKVIAESPSLIINQPIESIRNMNDWCKETHSASGLTDEVLASKLTIEEAEDKILAFVKKHVPKSRVAVLAGNSVHVDREFLTVQMPRLIDHLHFRIVDVSTIKELAGIWYPDWFARIPKKQSTHRALEDLRQSIGELRLYKKHFFLPFNDASYTL